MKLYKVPQAEAGKRWHSAKTGLRVVYGDAQPGDTIEVELPKEGRQGMADFLNGNEREVALEAFGEGAKLDDEARELDELEQAERRAAAEASQGIADRQVAVHRDWEARDIQDFLLDRATVAQCEAVFACLGTRFKELAKHL